MTGFLKVGGASVRLDADGVERISTRIEYNPLDTIRGVLGFHLRGSRILPVVDLNGLLDLPRSHKVVYLVLRDIVFRIEYESITSKPHGEELDLSRIARAILGELGV